MLSEKFVATQSVQYTEISEITEIRYKVPWPGGLGFALSTGYLIHCAIIVYTVFDLSDNKRVQC